MDIANHMMQAHLKEPEHFFHQKRERKHIVIQIGRKKAAYLEICMQYMMPQDLKIPERILLY